MRLINLLTIKNNGEVFFHWKTIFFTGIIELMYYPLLFSKIQAYFFQKNEGSNIT